MSSLDSYANLIEREHDMLRHQEMSDYPKLLIHRGKHGDRFVICLDMGAELRGWLAMFLAMDKWDRFYEDLTNEDEIEWRNIARKRIPAVSSRAARNLLMAHDDYEYEEVSTEYVMTPTKLMEQIDDQL